jgi:hypothetical protein
VDVEITAVSTARVGLGDCQFIVNVGVLMAEATATRGAGSPRLLFAEPTFHESQLLSKHLIIAIEVLRTLKGLGQSPRNPSHRLQFTEQLMSNPRFLVQLWNPGVSPKKVTARFRFQDRFSDAL